MKAYREISVLRYKSDQYFTWGILFAILAKVDDSTFAGFMALVLIVGSLVLFAVDWKDENSK